MRPRPLKITVKARIDSYFSLNESGTRIKNKIQFKLWRSCLSLLLTLLAVLVLSACTSTGSGSALAQGPIVGAVTSDSVSIWVRTQAAASVEIEYSTDLSLAGGQKTPPVTTDAGRDFTTIVSITSLAPQTTYAFNVRVNNTPYTSVPYPQFKTFPLRGDAAPFRFVILTDFRTVSKINQPVDTFLHAVNENPAFVILGGDFDHRNPISLDDKRTMFRDLYTPANGMEAFVNLILKRFPVVHFWDDHDYGDNNADKTYPDKQMSLQVLQEYFPIYPVTPHGDWQQFSYGNADFFVLDSRSQRDPAREPDSTTKSMLDGDDLGDAGQLTWLLDGLKNSDARWKFILSPVILNPTTKEFDGWAAYATERQKILDFLKTNNIQNVIVLSGDLHAGAIDDGTNSGLPELVAPTANDGFDKRCLTEGTGNLGKWTGGIYADAGGTQCNGYALIEVSPDQVHLVVKDSQGKTRMEYAVAGK